MNDLRDYEDPQATETEEGFWSGADAAFEECLLNWELPRSLFMEGWRMGRHAERTEAERTMRAALEFIAAGTWTASGDSLGATYAELQACRIARRALDSPGVNPPVNTPEGDR